MRLKPETFRELQRQWYRRLEESGFLDIERGETLLEYSSIKVREINGYTKGAKEQYFYHLGLIANAEGTAYNNETDRYVMIRYARGMRIKTIVDELKAIGTPRNRKTVSVTIKRYEIAWGIRFAKRDKK